MSRYHSYLNSTAAILAQYRGEEPFASFIKKYFSANKRYGSKDRKHVSHLCYCYFRLGKAFLTLPVKERIVTGLFLCSDEPNELLANLQPGWNEKTSLSLQEKCSIPVTKGTDAQHSSLHVFPWKEALSTGIDHEMLASSFFVQPDLFLRLRPGQEIAVQQKLQQAGIEFNIVAPNCLALRNASKIDRIIELNKEAVIQDYSSQRVGEFMITGHTGTVKPRVWDCCAASGGKSIMACDLIPGIELTVSDIRESILANLQKRFSEAGIDTYQSFVIDLAKGDALPVAIGSNVPLIAGHLSQEKQFSMVIADVPCTGSGTWSRTPEQLYYFEEKRIEIYAALQKKILSNVVPHIEKGGFLLYSTCSVFKKENEDAVAFIQQNFPMELKKMEMLKGYDRKADTLFAALLQRGL